MHVKRHREETMKHGTFQGRYSWLLSTAVVIALFVSSPSTVRAQFDIKWMSVGSLQSWYSSIGCEIEEGRVKVQQDGLRWPAIYNYQDVEAAKALWIGVNDYTDVRGLHWDKKAVHVGPRVTGVGEFFPVKFELVSKFDPPSVFVDGNPSVPAAQADVDRVDPTIGPDRIMTDVANTAIGVTMTRKIMAFSQQYHDNYIIYDYEFKNTGITDGGSTPQLPNQVLKDLYVFFHYRYASCADTRFVIGNATGWGINTMLDMRGDTTIANPQSTFFPGNKDNDIRATYAWHGKFPAFTRYDNIGGPIFDNPYYDKTDTSGRIGAPQFVGLATLFASKSAAQRDVDDPGQPRTTMYQSSDDPLTSNNDQFNDKKMVAEYGWMTMGHMLPRHADKVGPTGDPALGTPGGFSNMNGYGPYTLNPGESIRLVMVEAAAGLSRDECRRIGRAYMNNEMNKWPNEPKINAAEKNRLFYTGRDSLFKTFRNAIANWNSGSGFTLAQAPLPPKVFQVNGGGDRIALTWDVYNPDDPNTKGFEVYRAIGRYDSTYYLIASLAASAREFNDLTAVRGVQYYYYLQAVGDLSVPGGPLKSSRYYTQSYDPTFLTRAPGKVLDEIRIVPNPYIKTADQNKLLFPGNPDRIGFLNIPGECTIKIYTELGELIREIPHTNRSGDEYWNMFTSSNQMVVSGVYIAVIESQSGTAVRKFVVIR